MQHPGPPDQPEVPHDHPGNPFPKRDGLWETAGGKEYYSRPQPGLGLYSPLRGFLFYTTEVIYRKSITIVIRTPTYIDRLMSSWEILKQEQRFIDHLQAISYEILMSCT